MTDTMSPRYLGQAGRTGPWVQTFTGRRFYLVGGRPEDVEPADIAWSLGHICRYGGHCNRFYSVAEHSLLMSGAVAPEHALAALLHDAPEAYLGDVTRPLKQMLPDYAQLERRVWGLVAARFGLAETLPAAVKAADLAIMADERKQVLGNTGPGACWDWDPGPGLGVAIAGWAPREAALRFLDRLRALGGAAA